MINRTDSNEKDSFDIKTLVPFKNFALQYSWVGAAAGAASKFLLGAA
jgi:hypothetical protein